MESYECLTTEEQKKALVSKGYHDFSNAIISFTQAHSMLLIYATNLNLQRITAISNELREEIKDIDKVSKAIKGISTKTRMLSINASIEAARAGSVGKGFAVVAEEVGNLSKQTTNCTSEVDAANISIFEKVNINKQVVDKVQADLSRFTDASELISQDIHKFAKIEESGFILTLLAKRLENHSDFIRNLIKNAGKQNSVVDHHNCALGKWYDGNKAKYSFMPEFVNLYDIHRKFHDAAGDFCETLRIESILDLVDISHDILKCFIALTNAFAELAEHDETLFNIK